MYEANLWLATSMRASACLTREQVLPGDVDAHPRAGAGGLAAVRERVVSVDGCCCAVDDGSSSGQAPKSLAAAQVHAAQAGWLQHDLGHLSVFKSESDGGGGGDAMIALQAEVGTCLPIVSLSCT
eukprot:537709-Hanusia_phi.AAC.2